MEDIYMRKDVKRFVISSVDRGGDKRQVREHLEGKISDVELGKALRYFDKLCLYKKRGKKITFLGAVLFPLYIIRLILLFIVFMVLQGYVWIRKFLFGSSEEIRFTDVQSSFNLLPYLRGKKISFNKKPRKERGKIIIWIVFFLVLASVLIYSNFIYSKNCSNASCFREMVSGCNRANFISTDLISLENRVTGLTLKGCRIEVESLGNMMEISEGKKMVCYFPKGLRVLPQTKIEFCTGELREDIQELIISELYKTLGQNVGELSSLFRM
jgi:hypothetical protein